MQARKLASMKPNITFIFGLKAPLCNLGHYHHFVMNLILEFDLWEWGEGRQNKYFFRAKKTLEFWLKTGEIMSLKEGELHNLKVK